ncbi:hypothetical protein L211DRAFT_836147 [Terfezia boudieri ATCC MYA-4762]|uniref:Uncharacterized protein n=1 Tax=Terfezia boudieri ATCC MYA-4762 TaxID=1051890 RepID=A0A3N4LT01_9PEZI|nr:hypothetical protein L211DRAFT_836147 [Terfezia boudieri ATCC MYA-4762]
MRLSSSSLPLLNRIVGTQCISLPTSLQTCSIYPGLLIAGTLCKLTGNFFCVFSTELWGGSEGWCLFPRFDYWNSANCYWFAGFSEEGSEQVAN